jgi:preprotein translocase subunit SecE
MAKAKDNKAGKAAKAPAKSTVRNRAMNQQSQKRKRGSIKDYFKGVKLEMKKVVWPTKQELGSYTVVVLVACAAFALAFWAIDSGFLAVLKALLGITM